MKNAYYRVLSKALAVLVVVSISLLGSLCWAEEIPFSVGNQDIWQGSPIFTNNHGYAVTVAATNLSGTATSNFYCDFWTNACGVLVTTTTCPPIRQPGEIMWPCDNPGCPLQGAPYSSLVGRIDPGGPVWVIGCGSQQQMAPGQSLTLGFNDFGPPPDPDNAGSFTGTLVVTPVARREMTFQTDAHTQSPWAVQPVYRNESPCDQTVTFTNLGGMITLHGGCSDPNCGCYTDPCGCFVSTHAGCPQPLHWCHGPAQGCGVQGILFSALIYKVDNGTGYAACTTPTAVLHPGQAIYLGHNDCDGPPDNYGSFTGTLVISGDCVYDCANGSIGGTVRNEQGRPIQNATVEVRSAVHTGRASTDANGHYSISGFPSHGYTVQITAETYCAWYHGVDIGCNQWVFQDATLQGGVDLEVTAVHAYQTLRVDQTPLIAGKKTVIIATVVDHGHYCSDSGGYGIPVEGYLTITQNGRQHNVLAYHPNGAHPVVKLHHTVQDTIDWKDAIYFVDDQFQEGNATVSAYVHPWSGEDLHVDDNVRTVNVNFATSPDLYLHFVPIWGILPTEQPSNSFVDSYVDNMQTRISEMLPVGDSHLHFIKEYSPIRLPCTVATSWAALWALSALSGRNAGGSNTFYIGLYPGSSLDPSTPGILGKSGRLAGMPDWWSIAHCMLVCELQRPSVANNSMVLVHELGHSLAGLFLTSPELTVQCSQWPAPSTCVLDEWGLCIYPNFSESDACPHGRQPHANPWDVMASGEYCSDWLRLHPTYSMFGEALRASNRNGPSPISEFGPYCVISGIVARNSSAAPMFQVQNYSGDYSPVLPDSGAFRIEWYDPDFNEVLQTIYFDPVFERREGLLDYANFFIVAPRPVNARHMILYDGDVYVGGIDGTAQPPVVHVAAPNGGENLADSTVIRWSASDPDDYSDSLRYDVFANRSGGNWEPLAMGVRDTFLLWHVNTFPGTNAGRVKVVVSDGWNNSADSSDGTFTIQTHLPVATIESPQDTATILSSSYVSLSGRATDLESGNIGFDSLLWTSNLSGALGHGTLIQAGTLAVGLHTIMLDATDGDGLHGYAFTHVNVQADNEQDGMADLWEAAHRLDTTRNDGYADFDHDDLINLREYQLGTWPDSADTDHDGFSDGYEVSQGSSPTNVASHPGANTVFPAPLLISPIGTLSYGASVSFSWNASNAVDSLRPIRYEVHFDADPAFSNPITLYADSLTYIACPFDLAAGLPYYWKVKATDVYGHWVWSEDTSFTRGYNPVTPARVDSLVVKQESDGLHLSWSPVIRDSAGDPLPSVQYVIYATPSLDQAFQPIAYSSSPQWTDTEVNSLQWSVWFYRVRAITDGNPPALSSRRSWAGLTEKIHRAAAPVQK